MAQVRKIYRGCKVWADADEAGELVVERGLVKVRYRREDAASYSARLDEIGDVPPEAPRPEGLPEPAAGDAADAPPKPKRPRAPRKKAAPKGGAAGGAVAGETLVIYADGSCFGNPGPAGIGVLLEWKGKTKELSEYLGEGTNNIAELTAIERALQEVKNRRLPVRVHTDSQYSIGVLSEGWKVKANQELVARVQRLMDDFTDLKLVKVRGHAGDPRNERVDQLARDAIERRGGR